MTPKQVAMIQTSWLEVEPISDVAATLFYERLFDLDPTSAASSAGPTWSSSARS